MSDNSARNQFYGHCIAGQSDIQSYPTSRFQGKKLKEHIFHNLSNENDHLADIKSRPGAQVTAF